MQEGVLDVIDGRVDLNDAIVQARVGASGLEVLPTVSASNYSDLVGSSAMMSLLEDLKRHGQSGIVILDLPPLLTGHDVISILPMVDCVLLVAAIGTTKVSEIRDCTKYLEGVDVVRFVLNKVPAADHTLRLLLKRLGQRRGYRTGSLPKICMCAHYRVIPDRADERRIG